MQVGAGGRPGAKGVEEGRGDCGDTFTRMDQSQPPFACESFTGGSDAARPPPPVTNTRSPRSDGPQVVPPVEKLALPLFIDWSGCRSLRSSAVAIPDTFVKTYC